MYRSKGINHTPECQPGLLSAHISLPGSRAERDLQGKDSNKFVEKSRPVFPSDYIVFLYVNESSFFRETSKCSFFLDH
jgi:hypothetical protein